METRRVRQGAVASGYKEQYGKEMEARNRWVRSRGRKRTNETRWSR